MRQKKALLVALAVLILPVSVVWRPLSQPRLSGRLVPFIYFAVSLGSVLVFARTQRFHPFLIAQLSTSC